MMKVLFEIEIICRLKITTPAITNCVVAEHLTFQSLTAQTQRFKDIFEDDVMVVFLIIIIIKQTSSTIYYYMRYHLNHLAGHFNINAQLLDSNWR